MRQRGEAMLSIIRRSHVRRGFHRVTVWVPTPDRSHAVVGWYGFFHKNGEPAAIVERVMGSGKRTRVCQAVMRYGDGVDACAERELSICRVVQSCNGFDEKLRQKGGRRFGS